MWRKNVHRDHPRSWKSVNQIQPLTEGISVECVINTLLNDISIGDSVCVNGVCSTVTKMTATSVFFDYMEETLKKSNFDKLSVDDHVNLELSLTPSTKMGGHFVTGHIDCVGTISQFDIKDPWAILKIQFPDSFAPYIIPKGSVAIDGISLTVVDAGKNELSCHLIPHTLQETILSDKKVGDSVNLEFDMIGKYLFRFKNLDAL